MDSQAYKRILEHGGIAADGNTGFVSMFRPYRGLEPERFYDLMTSLESIAEEFQNDNIRTTLMAALWSIQASVDEWVLNPDGLLQANHLISTHDLLLVRKWMSTFSWSVLRLLVGADPAEVFRVYRLDHPRHDLPVDGTGDER